VRGKRDAGKNGDNSQQKCSSGFNGGQEGDVYEKCKKESPFLPIVPILRIAESITYAESMRDWGSNPPPATNRINHLHKNVQNRAGTDFVPLFCSVRFTGPLYWKQGKKPETRMQIVF